MWCNVGKEKLKKLGHLAKAAMEDSATLDKRGVRKGYWKVRKNSQKCMDLKHVD